MKTIIVLIFMFITLASCAQHDSYSLFVKELNSFDKIAVSEIDTIVKKSMVIYLPITRNDFVNEILKVDLRNNLNNPKYSKAEITYKITQSSKNFVSFIKSIYIEEASAPNGYFAWDECFNYYRKDNSIIHVDYNISKSVVVDLLQQSIKEGKIEKMCLNEDIISLTSKIYYFQDGKLYIHNPISYPTCWIDINISLSEKEIVFGK